jgi:hypothetical protein
LVGALLAPKSWRWLPPVLAIKLIVGHATPDGVLARVIDRVQVGSDVEVRGPLR